MLLHNKEGNGCLNSLKFIVIFLHFQDTGAEEHAKQIVILKQDLKEMQDSHDDIAGKKQDTPSSMVHSCHHGPNTVDWS